MATSQSLWRGDRDEQLRMLETIEREGVNLTEWEETFIPSLRRQIDAGRPLTEKQAEQLERIYAERTP